jgi:hypothetical protein
MIYLDFDHTASEDASHLLSSASAYTAWHYHGTASEVHIYFGLSMSDLYHNERIGSSDPSVVHASRDKHGGWLTTDALMAQSWLHQLYNAGGQVLQLLAKSIKAEWILVLVISWHCWWLTLTLSPYLTRHNWTPLLIDQISQYHMEVPGG